GGGEVLAVDAQPVRGAPREVEPPVLVPVGQVARPVPAVAQPGPVRLLVVVVALKDPAPARLTISPMAWSPLTRRPCSSKRARGHSSPVEGATTATSTPGPAGGRPRASGGVPGRRKMVTTPSLEP